MRCFEYFKDDRICDMCGSKIRCKAGTHPSRLEFTDLADTGNASEFKPQYFSALNASEALEYIGKTMEFIDGEQIKSGEWMLGTLKKYEDEARFPFYADGFDNGGYQFCRTCPETFKKKRVKKIFEIWVVIFKDGPEEIYRDKDVAERRNECGDYVDCLHIKKEYEVEE